MSTQANPIYNDLPPGAKVVKGVGQQFSDLPAGATVVSEAAPPEPGILDTAREFYKLRPSEQEAINANPFTKKAWSGAAATGILKTGGQWATDVASMPGQLLKAPETGTEQFVEGAGGRGAVAVKRALLDPFYDLAAETYKAGREGRYSDMLRTGLLTPLGPIGAMANARIEEADPGLRSLSEGATPNPVGAAAKGLLDIAAMKVAPETTDLALRAGKFAGRGLLNTAAVLTKPIRHPIETFQGAKRLVIDRPAQALAVRAAGKTPPEQMLVRAAQPGVNQPKAVESAPIAGAEMQRVRAARNIEIRGGVEDFPNNAVSKAADLAHETTRDIWQNEMRPRLQAAGLFQVDTTPVANRIAGTVGKVTGELEKPISARATQRADYYRDRTLTLDDIEKRIEDLNQENRGYYQSSDPTMAPARAITISEIDALRKVFNDTLDSVTESGTRAIKNRWGAVRDMQTALDRQKMVQARQRGIPLYEALGYLSAASDVLGAVHAFNSPMTAAGKAIVGKTMARMRDPNFQLEQAFHGPNAFKASTAEPFDIVAQMNRQAARPALPAGPRRVGPAPDTSGTIRGEAPMVEPTTRAERLGLLLPRAPLLTPQRGFSSNQPLRTIEVVPAKRTTGRGPGGKFKRVYTSEPR